MSGPSDHPAAAYPTWLPRPKVPVTVVVGPPGNGALAYIGARNYDDDLVVDLAQLITDISGQPAHRAGPEWIVPALERRNDMLARLSRKPDCNAAWLISPAPMQWQRDHWARALGAAIELLDPGIEAALIGARDEGVEERWVHRWYAEAKSGDRAAARPAPGPRPAASKRGYGREHRVLRDEQLAREPWCRFCLTERQVKVRATVLDHIEPFTRPDGSFDGRRWGNPDNHRSLCEPCHNARGAKRGKPERAAGAGLDGRPLDPMHPWAKARTI